MSVNRTVESTRSDCVAVDVMAGQELLEVSDSTVSKSPHSGGWVSPSSSSMRAPGMRSAR